MTDPTQNTDLLSQEQPGDSPCHGGESTDNAGSSRAEIDADLEFVLRVQAGDTSAFGELIDRHQRSVYGIVSRMVSNRDEVDDLVQEIFVSAYTALGGFRREAKFSTWLHTIAVNMTLKRLRKMKHQNAISIDDPAYGLAAVIQAENEPSPVESLQQGEQNEAVRRAVDSLPDKQRIVVVMHYFEQRSCEEIAKVLKCSVGTIWSRLHYACRKLRGELRLLEPGVE